MNTIPFESREPFSRDDATVHEPRLRPLDVHELFKLDIPERQTILDPIIPEKGLAMLYAGSRCGKDAHSLRNIVRRVCGVRVSQVAGQ
jgi:hypothetical protein